MFNPDRDPVARTHSSGVKIAPERDIFIWYFLNSVPHAKNCGFEKQQGVLTLVDKARFARLPPDKQAWIREAWKAQPGLKRV